MSESEKLDLILEKISSLDTRLDSLDARLSNLEKKVDRLAVGQSEIKKELYSLDRRISDTYKVALDAWGQGIETKTLLESNTLKI